MPVGICPNQRQMRVWHLSKSTPNARMAFGGYECPFGIPWSSLLQRESTDNEPTNPIYEIRSNKEGRRTVMSNQQEITSHY